MPEREGRGKWQCALLLERGDIFTNCRGHSFGTESQPDSNIYISSPTKCRQQSWEQDRSHSSPPSHSQTAPKLSKRCKASARTTNCFLLCCHPTGCAGWTPKSLFALCSSFLNTLCNPLQIPPPWFTHTAVLSVYQVSSDFPGDEKTLFAGSPPHQFEHLRSWGLKKSVRNQTSQCWHQPVAWSRAADWWESAGRALWDVSSCPRDKHYSQMFRNTSFTFVSSVVEFLIVLESM